MKQEKHPPKSNMEKGFAALFVIVVVGASALIMAFNAAKLGIGQLELGFLSQKGAQAFSIADGCMEETLRRIRLDTNYLAGSTTTLTVANGTCVIGVASSGSQRTVIVKGATATSTSIVQSYRKKIRTVITLSGDVITIDSWEEISS